jgi:hypothetical protein
MAIIDENKLLNQILVESSQLLQASRGSVVVINSKPSLEFVFEPGKCFALA